MSQLQFYKYATWALLVINLAILGFFLLTKPHPKGGGPGGRARGLETEAIQLLQLDQEQQKTFQGLAFEHSRELRNLDRQERDQLRKYFAPLLAGLNSKSNENLLKQVKTLEEQKVILTYDHFRSVKDLLREEQQVHFEDFMKKALQILIVEERR